MTGISHLFQVTENMFADPNQSRTDNESPVSIGEAIDGSKVGNPFQPTDSERARWEGEKKQISVHMTMMKEQLESEKAARIESQVRRREKRRGRGRGARVRGERGRGARVRGERGRGARVRGERVRGEERGVRVRRGEEGGAT